MGSLAANRLTDILSYHTNDGQDELYEFKCTMKECYDELVAKEKSLSSEVMRVYMFVCVCVHVLALV